MLAMGSIVAVAVHSTNSSVVVVATSERWVLHLELRLLHLKLRALHLYWHLWWLEELVRL
jgi:hypothetical protein